MPLKSDLIEFLRNDLVEDSTQTVSEDDSLIDLGVLDSIGLMRIMQFVEETAQVRIPDREVTPDNFETVAAIDRLVHRLRTS